MQFWAIDARMLQQAFVESTLGCLSLIQALFLIYFFFVTVEFWPLLLMFVVHFP